MNPSYTEQTISKTILILLLESPLKRAALGVSMTEPCCAPHCLTISRFVLRGRASVCPLLRFPFLLCVVCLSVSSACRNGGTAERLARSFHRNSLLFGRDSAIARGRIRKCNARSSGLLLWCLDWLRTSPCLSCGRCWPPFPSASLAGGWPIAASGSDAGIPGRPAGVGVMVN